MQSLISDIETHVQSISATLILANSTTFTTRTEDSLSNLSTILPKSLANNIAFMFTSVRPSFFQDFSQDTVPEAFKRAPQFTLDIPNALQNSSLRWDGYSWARKMGNKETEMRMNNVKAAEQETLQMLGRLFNWMETLEPHPVVEITCLYEKYQEIEAKAANTLAQMHQATAKKAEIDKLVTILKKNSAVSPLPCSHMALKSYLRRTWGLSPTSRRLSS